MEIKNIFLNILIPIGILAIPFAVIGFFLFSVRIAPGEVGISVDMYGSDKGVQIEVLKTGRNFYNFITHDVIKYPIYIQQAEYENIQFQDVDGLALKANVAIAYKFDSGKVATLYEEYRKKPHQITKEYFPVWIRNAIVNEASKMQFDEIYGAKKEEFRMKVLNSLQDDFAEKGIIIDNVYFTNGIEIPETVRSRIDAKIRATQIAQQKENELRQIEADVKKKIAEEEGKAKSRIIEAESRAKAIEMVSRRLTDEYIQFRKLEIMKEAIDKWNGVQPRVVTESGLILDVGSLNK